MRGNKIALLPVIHNLEGRPAFAKASSLASLKLCKGMRARMSPVFLSKVDYLEKRN